MAKLCKTESQALYPCCCFDECAEDACCRLCGLQNEFLHQCYTYNSFCGDRYCLIGMGQLCLKSPDAELAIFNVSDDLSDDCGDDDCPNCRRVINGWICACCCTYIFYTIGLGSNRWLRGFCYSLCLIWFLLFFLFFSLDIVVFLVVVVSFPLLVVPCTFLLLLCCTVV